MITGALGVAFDIQFLKASPFHNTMLRPQTFAVLLTLASLGAAGCGGNDQDRPTADIGLGGSTGDHDIFASGPCEEGLEKTCSATIQQANGVKSCFRGTQYCVEGRWSECVGSADELAR